MREAVSEINQVKTVLIEPDADGMFRIGGTRVALDTVVAAFDAGATAEGVGQRYPSVNVLARFS